jgi:hypothetical protein
MGLGNLKPRPDELNFMSRRFDTLPGFLLEGMQHIDHSGKSNGVNGAISIAVFIVDHLQNTSAAESL